MKQKINNEAALFAMFCDPSSKSDRMVGPFLNEKTGTVWATNAHVLISVPPGKLSGEYPTNRLSPPALIDTHNTAARISIIALNEALEGVKQEYEEVMVQKEVECEECDGSGEVEWEYIDKHFSEHTDYFECPICNGTGLAQFPLYKRTGRMIPDHNERIKLGCGIFNAQDIQRLRDAMELLDVESVLMVRNHDTELNKFVVNSDIYIIMMPVFVSGQKISAEVKIIKRKEVDNEL